MSDRTGSGPLSYRLKNAQRRASFLPELEAYLARTGMAQTTFGLRAAKDGALVTNLRRGWKIGPKRIAKARQFMLEHPNGLNLPAHR
jgi:hypothetical protein